MHPLNIKATRADRAIADFIASHTQPPVEQATRLVTYGADEKILLAVVGAAWLYAAAAQPRLRPAAAHFFAVSLASAVLPHLLKIGVNQTRPDRLTLRGHWRGVPLSGRRRDAFPSGHALHMGALASAAEILPKSGRAPVRAIAAGLSLTRLVLLAHWASDVAAGFVLGVLLERCLRPFTYRGTMKP